LPVYLTKHINCRCYAASDDEVVRQAPSLDFRGTAEISFSRTGTSKDSNQVPREYETGSLDMCKYKEKEF